MTDLISRKAVIDIIHDEMKRGGNFFEHSAYIKIECAVVDLPVAYNLDKVLLALDARIEHHVELVQYEMNMGTFLDVEKHKSAISELDKVLEIVKRGGSDAID